MEFKRKSFRSALWAFLAANPVLAAAAGESGGMTDNYLILGIVAALLVFAFTRKGSKPAPVPVADPEPTTAEGESAVAESSEESTEAGGEDSEAPAEASLEDSSAPAETEVPASEQPSEAGTDTTGGTA